MTAACNRTDQVGQASGAEIAEAEARGKTVAMLKEYGAGRVGDVELRLFMGVSDVLSGTATFEQRCMHCKKSRRSTINKTNATGIDDRQLYRVLAEFQRAHAHPEMAMPAWTRGGS